MTTVNVGSPGIWRLLGPFPVVRPMVISFVLLASPEESREGRNRRINGQRLFFQLAGGFFLLRFLALPESLISPTRTKNKASPSSDLQPPSKPPPRPALIPEATGVVLGMILRADRRRRLRYARTHFCTGRCDPGKLAHAGERGKEIRK